MYDIVQGQHTSYIAGNVVNSKSRRLVSRLGDDDGAGAPGRPSIIDRTSSHNHFSQHHAKAPVII
jgi:hypothetical protein